MLINKKTSSLISGIFITVGLIKMSMLRKSSQKRVANKLKNKKKSPRLSKNKIGPKQQKETKRKSGSQSNKSSKKKANLKNFKNNNLLKKVNSLCLMIFCLCNLFIGPN